MKKHANLLNKGLFYYQKNELLEAKKVFEEVLKVNPNDIKALAFLGKINLEEQNFINAIRYFKKAERIKSEDTEIQNNLALIFEQLGQNIDTIRIDDEFKTLILNIMPQTYRHLYHAIFYEYKNENEIRKKIAQELHWEAKNIWHRILKQNEDPDLKNVGLGDLEYLINFAFSNDSPIFKAREMSYFTKILWKKVLKIDETNFLADSKIKEYEKRRKKAEMRNYTLLIEELSLSRGKDFLKKEKTDLVDSDYGKIIKNSFCKLSTQHFEMDEIKKVYQSDKELIQFLEVYNEYKGGLLLEDVVWKFHKLGITKEDIESKTFILPLLIDKESINKVSLNKPFYERAKIIKQTYLETGNLFRLIGDLENLERTHPENIDLKINMYRIYSKMGKDLKAKEKIAEISRLITYDNNKTLEKSLLVCFPKISKNDTFILIDNFFTEIFPPSAFVFKINKNYKSLKREWNALNILKDLIGERNLELKLPQVLSCTKNKGDSYLVMEASIYRPPTSCCIGSLYAKELLEELSHRREDEKSLILKKVIEEIARIHAHIPENLLQQVHTTDKEKNDKYYIGKIKQKFFGNLNKLIKSYNKNIKLNIKEYTAGLQQKVENVNRGSVEKKIMEGLEREISYYKEISKKIENRDFEIKQPILFIPRFDRGYITIAPHWEEYIQKCKENVKNGRCLRNTAMKLIKRAKKEFKGGTLFLSSFYSSIALDGVESYESFAKRELSKEDYKEAIKIAIEIEKKRIIGSLEDYVKEEIRSQKKSIKEMNEEWKLCYKEIYPKKSYITSEQEYLFFKDYPVILDILSNLKQGVYKDASLKNFLIDGNDNLIAIDFETLRNSPYQVDIAGALESVKYEEPSIRKELLKHYCDMFNLQAMNHGNLGKLIKNFDEFERNYYACAVHKCLIHIGAYLGFFLIDKEHGYDYKNECKVLFENVSWNLNQLKNYFNKSSAGYEKLDRLGIGIKNLEENLNLLS